MTMKVIKNRTKAGVRLLSIAALVFCMVVPAMAVDSPKSSTTRNGRTYHFWSTADAGTKALTGAGFITVSSKVPQGKLGVSVRVYMKQGTQGILLDSSDYTYNEKSNADAFFQYFSYVYGSKGEAGIQSYRVRSAIKIWDDSSGVFVTYTTEPTPYVSNGSSTMEVRSSAGDEISIQSNEKGEIYGPECELNEIGIEPDLILAMGKDGTVGYVKAADLEGPELNTPEEALAYQMQRPNQWEIPLYREDGETVIGSFVVGVAAREKAIYTALDENGEYPRTASGKTYGSRLLSRYVGYEPELISAVGLDGTRGYIKRADWEPEINTPEEALAYTEKMAQIPEGYLDVPLYDLEENVIGTFRVYTGNSEEVPPEVQATIDGLEQQRAAKLAAEG